MLLTADGQRLLVAESDSDSLAVIDVAGRRLERSVSVAPVASSARGSSPNALAFSPDATRLYLANAGENAVEVLDAASLTRLGRIPVGNYPTAVLATADAVWVANAKGSGVKLPPPDARPSRPRNAPPAPDGSASRPPPPSRAFPAVHLLGGTLSVVPTPSLSELADGTAAVAANNGRPALLTPALRCRPGQPPRFPLPLSAGQPTPIEHVMLLVRENKTYDAELGDLGRGNGDPNLTLFGERLTPNLHKLAREFALLDNFYSDAEASLQGHMWTTAAVANDFT